MRKEKFLQLVLSHIKYKKIRQNISQEIAGHIDERKEQLLREGMEEQKAAAQAVQQMGDPDKIGEALQRVHHLRCPWMIFLMIGLLAVAGIALQFYHERLFQEHHTFLKQVIYLAMGAGCMAGCYLLNYRLLYRISLPGFLTAGLLFALLTVWPGEKVQVSSPYLFGIHANPAILLFPLHLIFYAGVVHRFCDGSAKGFAVSLLLPLLPLSAMAAVPRMAYALLLAVGFFIILTVWITRREYPGDSKKALLLLGSCLAILGLIALLFLLARPYQLSRLTTFLHPESDPQGGGWVHLQIKNLIDSAKWVGDSGLLTVPVGDKSMPMIPSLSTDLILMFVVGRFGWLAGGTVVGLLIITIAALCRAVFQMTHSYGRILGASICAVFSFQVIINLMMCLNLLPIVGVSMPFLSFGGSSLVTNMAMLGLLMGIYRKKDVVKLEQTQKAHG